MAANDKEERTMTKQHVQKTSLHISALFNFRHKLLQSDLYHLEYFYSRTFIVVTLSVSARPILQTVLSALTETVQQGLVNKIKGFTL